MSQHPLYSDDTDPYQPPRIAYVPDRVAKTSQVVEAPKAEEPPAPPKQEEPATPARSPMLFVLSVLMITLSVLILAGSGGIFYYASRTLSDANTVGTRTAQNIQQFATLTAATSTTNSKITPTAATTPIAATSPTPTATPNAQANATAGPKATATASAVTAQNPYPAYKTLAFFDTLASQSANQWQVSDTQSGPGCRFSGGAYHVVTGTSGGFLPCLAQAARSNNAVFQVQMTVVQGSCGGLLFRAGNNGFYYIIVCNDGNYEVRRYDGDNKNPPSVSLSSGSGATIKQGAKQANLIAVAAHDSTFDFFVNGKQVATVNDTTYTEGLIGLLALPQPSSDGKSVIAGDVMYTNATVWTP